MVVRKGEWTLSGWGLAAVSLGAASIHFAVSIPHFDEYRPYGVFFLAVACFQAIWAVIAVTNLDRRLLLSGLVVNAAVIVVWLWSRIAGLPVGPEPGVAEQVGVADSISTAFEAVIVVWGALLLTSAAHIRKGSRRFVPALALLIWGTVIALSVWAVLAGTDGVPSRH